MHIHTATWSCPEAPVRLQAKGVQTTNYPITVTEEKEAWHLVRAALWQVCGAKYGK